MTSQATPTVLFNGYIASVLNVAALRLYDVSRLSGGAKVSVDGNVYRGDGNGGIYVYDPASTSTDDSLTSIEPVSGNGRWLVSAGKGLIGNAGPIGPIGATGGNAMSIGPFSAASGMLIADGYNLVRTSGYHTDAGSGGAFYASDSLAQNSAFRAANPLATFLSGTGVDQHGNTSTARGFRLLAGSNNAIDCSTMGALADGTGWSQADKANCTLTTENGSIGTAAVKYAKAIGAGAISFPPLPAGDTFFGSTVPIVMLPGVDFTPDSLSRLRNIAPLGNGYQPALLLLGNFHPAFLMPGTAKLYAVNNFAQGALSFVLTTATDRYDSSGNDRFAPGKQIAMISDARTPGASFQNPQFMILATVRQTVTSGSTATVTVDTPLDIPTGLTTCHVMSLAENAWRNYSWFPDNYLYFYSGNINGVNAQAYSLFANDTAMNGVNFDNITGSYGLGFANGNTFQNVVYGPGVRVSACGGFDISLCAYRVLFNGPVVTYRPPVGDEPAGLQPAHAIGAECGRNIKGSLTVNQNGGFSASNVAPIIRIQSGQNIDMDITLNGSGDLTNATAIFIGSGGANANAICSMQDINIRIKGVASTLSRAIAIDGQGSAYMRRITASYNVDAPITQNDAIVLGNVLPYANTDDPRVAIMNTVLPVGKGIVKETSTAKISVLNSVIPGGIGGASSIDMVKFADSLSTPKQAVNQNGHVDTTFVGTGAEALVFEVPIGQLIPDDVVTASIVARLSTGTAALRTFRWALWDTVTGTEAPQINNAIGSFTQPAASGISAIMSSIEIICASPSDYFYITIAADDRQGGGVQTVKFSDTYNNTTDTLTLRLYLNAPTTLTTLITRKPMTIRNPQRDYAG